MSGNPNLPKNTSRQHRTPSNAKPSLSMVYLIFIYIYLVLQICDLQPVKVHVPDKKVSYDNALIYRINFM